MVHDNKKAAMWQINGHSRVWAEGRAHHEERGVVVVQPPEAAVVASSVQVPHTQALGQRQPRAEVLGRAHRDEEEVGGAGG